VLGLSFERDDIRVVGYMSTEKWVAVDVLCLFWLEHPIFLFAAITKRAAIASISSRNL
jgi:hypothetical protein